MPAVGAPPYVQQQVGVISACSPLSNQRRRQQFRHPIHGGAHAARQIAALWVEQGHGHRVGDEFRQHFDEASSSGGATVVRGAWIRPRSMRQALTQASALLTLMTPCMGRVR
jgi:hypothetical protein